MYALEIVGKDMNLQTRYEKEGVYALTQKKISTAAKLAQLQALNLEPELIGAVAEILTAYEA